ncbi:hypothetical protein BC937DRAFT_93054 [Endogone sp. FLAS-F59071]|nr:hypothetical protein BC937DRAFT_93054 [Endogone sp. FLAS-F59071]|eukprot:RUS14991.1 hypothetical protein BC937DRAFT_93054 [Endogone sp. FLAS-F59071]
MSNILISTKVVVIGAGVSGLQAARLLYKQGIDVHVVEASERIGGRTKGYSFGEDGSIDLGGQWAGKNQKHLLKLLEEFDILLYDQYTEGKSLQSYPKYGNKLYSGTIPPLSVKGLLDLQLNGINRIEGLTRDINMDEISLSANAIEYDNMTVESFINTYCKSEDAKQSIMLAVRCIFGAEPGEISFLWFLYYCKSGGGIMSLSSVTDGAQELKISGTASAIAFRLADDIPADHIHLNASATRLVQTDTGVTVYTGYPGVEGPVIQAEYAILAIPPSQAGHIKYEPEMPFERVKLCEKAFMGAIVKIFVRYETAFWRDAGYNGSIIAYNADDELAALSMVYDAVSKDEKIKGLVVFCCGRNAQEYTRMAQTDPLKIKTRILAKLVECFGEKASNPIDWVAQDWNRVPNMYGAYTNNFPPGCLSLFGDALRIPVGRVHFAGTETATEHVGYISGAIQAGERAASEVTECIKENSVWSLSEVNRKIVEERQNRKPAMHRQDEFGLRLPRVFWLKF